jgi:hypothetical protein
MPVRSRRTGRPSTATQQETREIRTSPRPQRAIGSPRVLSTVPPSRRRDTDGAGHHKTSLPVLIFVGASTSLPAQRALRRTAAARTSLADRISWARAMLILTFVSGFSAFAPLIANADVTFTWHSDSGNSVTGSFTLDSAALTNPSNLTQTDFTFRLSFRPTGKPAWPSGKRTFWFAMNLRWSFWRAEGMAVGGASHGVAPIVVRRAGAGPGLRGRPRDHVALGRFSKIARELSVQSSLSTCHLQSIRSIRRATFERASRFIVQSSSGPRPAMAQLSGTGRPRHSS